jgi:hypothetical protein
MSNAPSRTIFNEATTRQFLEICLLYTHLITFYSSSLPIFLFFHVIFPSHAKTALTSFVAFSTHRSLLILPHPHPQPSLYVASSAILVQIVLK